MKKFYLLLLAYTCTYAQVPNNTVTKYLDKNKVKAEINMLNNKFWQVYGTHRASYEVPKGKNTHAQFGNSIWIGGYDNQGLLHLSANTYRQRGTDFWPGPLDTTNMNSYNSAFTSVYNDLWKVDCNDITAFVTAFNNGSVTAGTYTVPPDILHYPAKGLGNFQQNLELFHDANNNALYSPATDGDYPIIKGQQQILSIFNDNFGTHTEEVGPAPPALGLEIHERAYAYSDSLLPDSMQAVNYSTFYNYTIYNRSNITYTNVFISDWSDVDLGYYLDDYIGTDSVNNFAYCYNGDAIDENGAGTKGYGTKPPVVSHAILQTSYCTSDGIDNDGDGQIDEPGEQFLLDWSSYYQNPYTNPNGPNNAAMSIPDSALHYYRYMSGLWKDGAPITFGGDGRTGTVPSKYVFTGNPATNTGWTESSAGLAPGDARVIYGSGPFTFPAHSKIEWGYAIVFSQDTTQPVINTISEFNTRVQRDVRNARYYDQIHQTPQCAPAVVTTGISEFKGAQLNAMLYPNPAGNKITIQLSENIKTASVALSDVSGRIVKQKSITEASSTDLDIQDLESGVYFVEVTSGNSKTVMKLIRSN